jgi:hypothetical protein
MHVETRALNKIGSRDKQGIAQFTSGLNLKLNESSFNCSKFYQEILKFKTHVVKIILFGFQKTPKNASIKIEIFEFSLEKWDEKAWNNIETY